MFMSKEMARGPAGWNPAASVVNSLDPASQTGTQSEHVLDPEGRKTAERGASCSPTQTAAPQRINKCDKKNWL